MRIVLVIAGNFDEYQEWTRRFSRSLKTPPSLSRGRYALFDGDTMYRYVKDAKRMLGLKGSEYIIYGSARERADWPELDAQLRMREYGADYRSGTPATG